MKLDCMPSGMLRVNTYIAVDEDTKTGFIVDPGGYNPKLAKKIEKHGITIKYIILTHGHADHICGVDEHRSELPGVKVVAHASEKPMLLDANFNQSMMFGQPHTVEADMFVQDGDELNVGNLILKFIHTPGHTPGGMCIYIPSEHVLFSGDTLFHESIGRTDFMGGSFPQIQDSIRNKLFLLPDDTKVYSGHTRSTTIGHEKVKNPFV